MKIKHIAMILSIALLAGCGCSKAETTEGVVPETETEVLEIETETEVIEVEIETETEVVETEVIEVEIVEVMDVRMYVVKEEIIRAGDSTDFKMINTLMKGGSARVTGKTANGWYEIDCVTVKGYVPADALSATNPNESTSTPTTEHKQSEETTNLINKVREQREKEKENATTNPGSGQGTWNGGEAPDGLGWD